MQEKDISPAESLQIINSMINKSKNKLADDGFLIIFWGWLVFIAALAHYILISLNIQNSDRIWILMPIGGVFSAIYGYRQNKNEKVKTHLNNYLAYCWGAFIIALLITVVFMEINGIRTSYFFLMILYGVATFISGGLLNFRPLVIGSLFSFLFAIVSVFTNHQEILLCVAASILCSYIIPGHLLNSKYKSQNV